MKEIKELWHKDGSDMIIQGIPNSYHDYLEIMGTRLRALKAGWGFIKNI